MKACKSYKRIAMFVEKGFATNDWPSLLAVSLNSMDKTHNKL